MMILNFGKHRGKSITQCPKDYLTFLLTQAWLKTDLRDAIDGVLKGTYVSPVPIPEMKEPKLEPYHPDQLAVKVQATRKTLTAVVEAIKGKVCPGCKAKVIEALVGVADDLGA